MLSLAFSVVSASPQNTALTPNQPNDAVPRSRHPDPSGTTWADHPETTLRSQSSRGDLQPAAKSHSVDTPTGTSGWRDSNRQRLDQKMALDGTGPDHSTGATYMCTDVNFEDAELGVHNFGGPDFCCTVCNDNTQICCPSKDAGGDLGEFVPGDMVEEFEACVFDASTPIGQPVGPIQSPFGFHVIIVDERTGTL